jgi:uncharacterized protein HemY
MGAGFVGLIAGIGVGAWTYSKFSRRTNNAQTSVIVAVVVGLIAFVVLFTLFSHF